MYEDVLAGEDAAKAVLSILAEGPKGQDEEGGLMLARSRLLV